MIYIEAYGPLIQLRYSPNKAHIDKAIFYIQEVLLEPEVSLEPEKAYNLKMIYYITPIACYLTFKYQIMCQMN